MSLETLESRIIYESISSGVNLEYILTGATLKENIILSSADANKPFVYDCLVTGLVPELLDNEIYFKNTSGETILRMQAPYMYDSAGAYSDAVTLSLEASGSGWKITIQADDLWLLDEERVYPVVIDPVISSSVDQADIKDASVCLATIPLIQ